MNRPSSFPIVAIGASAGGVDALLPFVRAIPEKTGMAFVIVQHLDPSSQELLPAILTKVSKIAVRCIANNLKPTPDAVYVAPKGKVAELAGGAFRLRGPSKNADFKMPINRFMVSLAKERGGKSAGVVLSGTNNDGTLGLKAIRDAGGLTFTQPAATARYAAMPRSASNYADFILPPKAIAERISGCFPPRRGKQTPTGNDLRAIYRVIRDTKHVDFSDYKQTTMLRRISRRMLFNKIPTAAAYAELLERDAAELDALYGDLLIHVTSFFRDARFFEQLKKRIIPGLLKRKKAGEPLRIWVAGCSSGEEVYSLAMIAAEIVGEERLKEKVQIFATDIKDQALRKARAGFYGNSIGAAVSGERLKRFFVKKRDGYRIAPLLRDVCVFVKHNVLGDPPFSKIDLLSCRNMLIYMLPDLQKRALAAFHFALNPGGILALGSSETVIGLSADFTPFDKKNNLYANEKTGASILPEFLSYTRPGLGTAEEAGGEFGESARGRGPGIQKRVDEVVLDKYAPSGVVVNDNLDIVHFRGRRTGGFLEIPSGKASLNLLKMLKREMTPHVHAALLKARKTGTGVTTDRILVQREHQPQEVVIEIVPLGETRKKPDYFLILFNEIPVVNAARGPAAESRKKTGAADVRRLKRELALNKEYLRVLINEKESATDELKSAYEEIQSSNEELRSANEELETSKEELQSANEELTTVNEELHRRNAELARLNDDLKNYLEAMGAPVIVLGRKLDIRHFTPAAGKLFNLRAADADAALPDLRLGMDREALGRRIRRVMSGRAAFEQEVCGANGAQYLMRISPYLTKDGKIDGAVIVFFDVSELKHAHQVIRENEEHFKLILKNSPITIYTQDRRLRYTWAFNPKTGAAAKDIVGKSEEDLFASAEANKLRKAKRSVLRTGKARRLETEIRLKGGTAVFELLIEPTRDASGAINGIMGIGTDVTERKRAEERIADIAKFPMQNPNPILRVSSKGALLFANPGAAPLLRAWGVKVGSRVPAELKKYAASCFKAARPEEREMTVAKRIYSLALSPVCDLDYVIVYGRDVTERKKAEEAVRESERKFTVMFESAPIALSLASLEDGALFDVNRAWLELTGFKSKKDVVGKTSVALGPMPDARTRGSILAEFRKHGHARNVEVPFRTRSGKTLELLVNARRVEVGDRGYMLASHLDITDRKKAEAALIEGETRLGHLNRVLRTLSASSQAMMRATDEPSYLEEVCRIVVNDGGYRMAWIGYAEDDEAKSVRPVAHAGYEEGYLATLKITWADTDRGRGPSGTAIREGRPDICPNMLSDPRFAPWLSEASKRGYNSSIALPLKDGGRAFGALMLYSSDTNPFTEEEVRLLVELADDLAYGITALRLKKSRAEAEEVLKRDKETLEKLVSEQANEVVKSRMELERAKRLTDMGRFASTVAHELRNPLATIKIAAHNIRRKAPGPEFAPQLDNIDKKVGESNAVIENMLAFARTKEPAYERVRPCDILRENLAAVAAKYRDWEVEIREDYRCPAGETIQADPGQLAALFSNILDNAFQALPDGKGRIDVAVVPAGSAYRITIRDNGTGIDQESLDKIFEPFFTTKTKGTGLGLTVCREIVMRHNGSLDIESVKGEGTTMIITLPVGQG